MIHRLATPVWQIMVIAVNQYCKFVLTVSETHFRNTFPKHLIATLFSINLIQSSFAIGQLMGLFQFFFDTVAQAAMLKQMVMVISDVFLSKRWGAWLYRRANRLEMMQLEHEKLSFQQVLKPKRGGSWRKSYLIYHYCIYL